MSGVVKAIGRAFKKVTNVVKKVALPALAIGAVVLTGGAALGLGLPSVGSVVGGLGLSSGLSSVLTGAITQAGYGAMIGGAGAALTGKSVTKGLMAGAGIGAITGGITGALSGGAAATGAASGGAAATDAAATTAAGVTPAANTVAQAAQTTSAALAPTATGGGGLLAFANKNPILAGSILQGIGGALGGSEGADTVRAGYREAAKNYEGATSGLLTQADVDASGAQAAPGTGPMTMTPQTPLAAPAERFEPTQFMGGGNFQYDPALGRVVFVRSN